MIPRPPKPVRRQGKDTTQEETLKKTIRSLSGRPLLLLLACCALAVALVVPAGASTGNVGPSTITFKEPEKGSTFHFIDNPPKSKHGHGSPTISAGDVLVFQNPLTVSGKQIGHLEATCTATKSSKDFEKADFQCQGTYVFANGTLTASALIGKNVEGAITGGTGAYAGARGTFKAVEKKHVSTVTITLVE